MLTSSAAIMMQRDNYDEINADGIIEKRAGRRLRS
jgi:hypothetical protein